MDTPETTPAEPSAPDLFANLDQPEGESPTPPEPTPEPAPTPAETAPASASPVASALPVPPEPGAAPDRTVPLATLIEERKKHDAAYAELQAKLEAIEQRLKPSDEPKSPEFMEDPKGYVDAQGAKIQETLKKLEEQATKRIDEVARTSADIALDRSIVAAQEQFVTKTADFQDALTFARESRVRVLQEMNPGVELPKIIDAVSREERQLAANFLQQGLNPAEKIYGIAKAMGYTPKAAGTNGAAPPVSKETGKVVPPDVTLNATPGQQPGTDDEGEQDILEQARNERFVRKRA